MTEEIVFKTEAEMPPPFHCPSERLWSTRRGGWRYLRPLYVDKTPTLAITTAPPGQTWSAIWL